LFFKPISLTMASIDHPYSSCIHIINGLDWLCSVLRPRQHSIGYMGDSFYRSKDPTNSIKVLKENLQRKNQTTQRTKYICIHN